MANMNESDDNGGNSTFEDGRNIYLVDFAYGAFAREKEFYVALSSAVVVAAVPLAVFIVAQIMWYIFEGDSC